MLSTGTEQGNDGKSEHLETISVKAIRMVPAVFEEQITDRGGNPTKIDVGFGADLAIYKGECGNHRTPVDPNSVKSHP
jgi:hypothetical protein